MAEAARSHVLKTFEPPLDVLWPSLDGLLLSPADGQYAPVEGGLCLLVNDGFGSVLERVDLFEDHLLQVSGVEPGVVVHRVAHLDEVLPESAV